MTLLIISLVVLWIFFNFVDDNIPEEYKEFYKNGNFRMTYNYINGVMNGKLKEYLPNGELFGEYYYINGKKED